uniref:Uncharacterized protein n=1 Tax=Arundo donax TaxID=35708 RepID=A0A0A9EP71_ARUDO
MGGNITLFPLLISQLVHFFPVFFEIAFSFF